MLHRVLKYRHEHAVVVNFIFVGAFPLGYRSPREDQVDLIYEGKFVDGAV
jgi:hypothetical protein